MPRRRRGTFGVRSEGYADLANRMSQIQRNEQAFFRKMSGSEDLRLSAKEASSGSGHHPSSGLHQLMRVERGHEHQEQVAEHLSSLCLRQLRRAKRGQEELAGQDRLVGDEPQDPLPNAAEASAGSSRHPPFSGLRHLMLAERKQQKPTGHKDVHRTAKEKIAGSRHPPSSSLRQLMRRNLSRGQTPELTSGGILRVICQTRRGNTADLKTGGLRAQNRRRLWTDENVDRFVADNFPERIRGGFAALPLRIMQIDVFRYLLMHHEGGVYFDVDLELRKPLDSILGEAEVLLPMEEGSVARPRTYGQAFLASRTGHPPRMAAA